MAMKQVSREDFEVLSKYHPTEIRYYADTGTEVTKRKPTRVTVKRNRKPIKHVGVENGVNRRANASKFVQLTTKGAGNMRSDSMQYRLYCETTRLLNEDPTKVLRRSDLTAKLVKKNPGLNKVSQIVPAISALIKGGYIRYTGEASS